MSYIDEVLTAAKAKLKSAEGKEALKFLSDHKKELEGLGKDLLSRLVAAVGAGEPELAKDLYLILYQSPEDLIKGVSGSGDVFIASHKKVLAQAKAAASMWAKLGEDAARVLLPFIVSVL